MSGNVFTQISITPDQVQPLGERSQQVLPLNMHRRPNIIKIKRKDVNSVSLIGKISTL